MMTGGTSISENLQIAFNRRVFAMNPEMTGGQLNFHGRPGRFALGAGHRSEIPREALTGLMVLMANLYNILHH